MQEDPDCWHLEHDLGTVWGPSGLHYTPMQARLVSPYLDISCQQMGGNCWCLTVSDRGRRPVLYLLTSDEFHGFPRHWRSTWCSLVRDLRTD